MKKFLIFASIIVSIALFGFVLPWLFSAKSNEAVLIGTIVLIAIGYLIWSIFWKFKNDIFTSSQIGNQVNSDQAGRDINKKEKTK